MSRQREIRKSATNICHFSVRIFSPNTRAGHYVILNRNTFKSSWGDLSPDELYSWLKKPEQKDALVIFAHPGFHFY